MGVGPFNSPEWWNNSAGNANRVAEQKASIAKQREQSRAIAAIDRKNATRGPVSPLGGEMQGRFRGISRAISHRDYLDNVKRGIEDEARRGFDPNRFRSLVKGRK